MTGAPSSAAPARVTFLGGDAELVAGLRAGNAAAQRAFFGRYARYVERVLRGVLGPDSAIEDALQDVFLSAFRQVPSLRSPEALTEWVRVIAVGVARNRLRARQRNRWLSFFAPDDVPEHAHAGQAPETTELVRAFYAVLDELPASQRLVFVLRHVEEMTVPELARATGVSESTAKRRLRAAEQSFEQAASTRPALCNLVDRERVGRMR
jgi:RNA polymerase sigma-70 factor (ECF subfamily)